MKAALTGLSLSVLIAGCVAVDTEKPHTEAYKGEYYDQVEPKIVINNYDFSYDYPAKPVQSNPSGEITNALANETYQYALTYKNNPQGRIETLYLAAQQGSGDAHYELARELTSGVNIDKNAAAAISHLQDAVELNHAEAMRVLGLMSIRGDSMVANIPEGMEMLESAAKHSTRAARELGILYLGNSFPQIKDDERARRYLELAYKDGDTESAYLLGQKHYENGNYIDAIEPLSFAASMGHGKAKSLIEEVR